MERNKLICAKSTSKFTPANILGILPSSLSLACSTENLEILPSRLDPESSGSCFVWVCALWNNRLDFLKIDSRLGSIRWVVFVRFVPLVG